MVGEKGKQLPELARCAFAACEIGCHGNHAISNKKNGFGFEEHIFWFLSGLIRPFDIN